MDDRQTPSLYQLICATFAVVAVLSNIISAKMVALPFLGDFIIPAGLITYPLTFLLSDLVTEIYGANKARQMVYVALAMNVLGFALIQFVLWLPGADSQAAFQEVMGLSGFRIFASLTAYLISQLVAISVYARLKKLTGQRFLWLRNNGSVCISQLVDTVLIDLIYLYWGLGMASNEVLAIMGLSYFYKAAFSVINTPFFYLCVYAVRKPWGEPNAPRRAAPIALEA